MFKSIFVLLIKFVVIFVRVLLELNNVLNGLMINYVALSNDIIRADLASNISEETCVKLTTHCFGSNWKGKIIIVLL